MAETDQTKPNHTTACGCFSTPGELLIDKKQLGMDGNFAEVTIQTCLDCGQYWLRYFYEMEAFTASGRWYLGAITEDQTTYLSAENAKEILESLTWYFYGGSYYSGKSGKTSSKIWVHP